MTDKLELTTDYMVAFDARELDKVSGFFSKNFELTDPEFAGFGERLLSCAK